MRSAETVARPTGVRPFIGVASALHAKWSVQVCLIFRLRDGKIVEHWAQQNDLKVRRQLASS